MPHPRVDEWFWGFAFELGLIGVLVLFAGVALLVTTRYPGGLFEFVLGLNRWVARVAAYVLLMRDEYPPLPAQSGWRPIPATEEASKEPETVVAAPAGPAPGRGREAGGLLGGSRLSSSGWSPRSLHSPCS